uniref:Uncharacterized protein n=1 Tax=uncultured organism TaxID=155900 RepID=M1Q263_9ZZZZ|nr:hypothetical protein FLSS-23_0007 [uncultured organism]
MATQLYSELIRSVVKNPAEKKKSKLVEMVAKEKDKYWEVLQLKIESGLISKKGMYVPTEDLKETSLGGELKLKKGIIEGRKNPSEEANLFLSRLNNEKILLSDSTEIGRVYDFEIHVSENPWKVWKLLVKPSGLSPLKKRLRIPVKSVDKITSEGIYLEEGWKEE